jgi:diguanylate cyclase (GGDEF)-like protein
MGNGGEFRILAVDDEKANLLVLNHILAEYTIVTAASGTEALERVAADKPDLILLDIIMPGIDGFEVLKRLKENEETAAIPVIIITGLSSDDDEEKGLLLGAVDYITKPFKNHIVQARVRTHIQIVRQMRTIEQLGLIDPLTGIANRRSFDDRIALEWRRAHREHKPLSFMMMDVDKFKVYNDTYGHPQGDALLRELAKIFAAAAKRAADLACRLGGEEFGVLLPETDMDAALQTAEKIRLSVEALRVPTKAEGQDGSLTQATISIGVVSMIPDDSMPAADFIAWADKRLYAAKAGGRNRVCSADS